jgi:hypothetical protein
MLGYKTAGACGGTQRRPMSRRLTRQCSDPDLPSYLSSAIGVPDLDKGERFPIGCQKANTLHSLGQILAVALCSAHWDASLPI